MRVEIVRHWEAYLERLPKERRDIYFSERYVSLYEDGAHVACCVLCEEGGSVLLYPFLRGTNDLGYDFETAYGYGGPVTNSNDSAWVGQALGEMAECLREASYVCGFTRFHPLLCNAGMAGAVMDVLFDRHTVAVDLTKDLEDVWKEQVTSKNRNMIRKAQKNGLVFRAEEDFSSMDGFVRMYRQTMERLGADDFYLFDEGYFRAFAAGLGRNGFLGTVTRDGRLVGAALFMYDGIWGHYHLAGSDRENGGVGVNNFLLWNAMGKLKEKGVRTFHLGGGTSALPTDSLFKFKRAFSPNRADFYIGKWIFNETAYGNLCERWERDNPEKVAQYGKWFLRYKY